MAEIEQATAPATVSDPHHGHERSDISLRAAVIFLVVFLSVAIVLHILIWLFMVWFERGEARQDLPASPVAESAAPPEPRLQPTIGFHPTLPEQDANTMNRVNRQILTSAGWVDRQRGIAHIPIDRAMQLMLQQAQAGPATVPATTAPAAATQPAGIDRAGGGGVSR